MQGTSASEEISTILASLERDFGIGHVTQYWDQTSEEAADKLVRMACLTYGHDLTNSTNIDLDNNISRWTIIEAVVTTCAHHL